MEQTLKFNKHDDAWTGIDTSAIQIPRSKNPLLNRTDWDKKNPGVHELRALTDTNYLWLSAKLFLGIDLLPFQAAVLEELWNRPFSIFMMSRGGGKSFLLAVYTMLKLALTPTNENGTPGAKIVLVGAAFRQSKIIFEYMETIWRNAPILRSICSTTSGPRHDNDRWTMYINENWAAAVPLGDGCLSGGTQVLCSQGFTTIENDVGRPTADETPKIVKRSKNVWGQSISGQGAFRKSDEAYYNGYKPTKKVVTNKGFHFESTHNHKMQILRNGEIQWCRADNMTIGDRILIDRSYRWHNGQDKMTKEEAYALGLLIGDGSWTNQYFLRFATKDIELVEALNYAFEKDFKPCGDSVHYNLNSKEERQNWLDKHGMKKCYTIDKYLPSTIMSDSRENMSACLRGLYDTDGHVQVSTTKGGTSITVGFTNTSEKLVDQMQYILLHYGIVACKISRNRKENKSWNTIYELLITGKDVKIFANLIGFGLHRKQSVLQDSLEDKVRDVSAGDIIPGVRDAMVSIASQYSRSGDRSIVASKIKDRKEVTRNLAAKFCRKYHGRDPFVEKLKELNERDVYYDEIISIEDGEAHTYDLHVPKDHVYTANGFCSHNSKIRGLRATTVISDEFASISPDIYETVIAGFAAVSSDPVGNVKEYARRKEMIDQGSWNSERESAFLQRTGNQAIISGTADYSFNHFADYHKRYCSFIRSKGDLEKVRRFLGEDFTEEDAEYFNYKDYAVIRIPYDRIPKGFMDDKVVMRAKATVHSAIYLKEYGCCFVTDSDGFFKRSLIESCVTSETEPVNLPSGPVYFDAATRGNPNLKYVFGVDPASEADNFSIVVIELHEDHSRVVYVWTTNRDDFKKRVKAGLTDVNDFYGYTARKIRELMRAFPCERIGIDAQGGGIAVAEALHDMDKLQPGELPIWEVIDDNKPKDTDNEPGLHILEMVQFAKSDWTAEANHGLRTDLEHKVLLFPRFDSITLEMSIAEDKIREDNYRKAHGKELTIYDTLEDAVLEIEELKDELTTIVMTRTGTGQGARDRWDTPETKLESGKKGRLRKDRYSSLIIANMIARQMKRTPTIAEYEVIGGFTGDIKHRDTSGNMYQSGPLWLTENQDTSYLGRGIVRKQ